MAALKMAGGYGGLLTAALAFYLSAADVINEAHQRTVLPLGAPKQPAAASQTAPMLLGPAAELENPGSVLVAGVF